MLQAHRGLTLLEALSALAVAAVLVSVGVPALSGAVANARRTTAVNDLIAAVHFARANAIRRSEQLVICPDSRMTPCDPSARWDGGWLVFVNTDRDRPPRLDDDEPVLLRRGRVAGLQVDANRSFFAFHRIGLRSTNGTLTFCDSRGAAAARAVIVSYTGRPRVAHTRADGRPLECS